MSLVTVEQVHEALQCLYMPTELAKCTLADVLPESQGVADLVQRAQLLRNSLLDAIQALRPTNRLAPSPSAARAYDCLKLRYVSGLSVEDVAYELSLSARQAYRDLRWAEERITQLLNSRYAIRGASAPAAAELDALTQEIEAMARQPERLSLPELVQAALSAVSIIARRQGVSLRYQPPERNVLVTATPGILKEAIIQLISAIAQSSHDTTITVEIAAGEGIATLSLSFGRLESLSRPDLMEAALRVANAQNLRYHFNHSECDTTLKLTFPLAARYRVLILEDKPGAQALYERYLENTELEPVPASDPLLAVDTVVAEGTEVVVLDIMMPQTDGWSVLQALRADPRTASVPVVICSVLNDRELGFSLGADDYLSKPVSRADFIDSLRRVLRQRRPV